ncbi:MAG TPA: flagellar hook-basal body complex protein FliE [Solirubrobacterales bacterium]|jgi:flagellar hook-basal body complex protein FliE
MTLPVSAITKAAEQMTLDPKKEAQPAGPAGGFGSMLTNAIGDLQKTQDAAAQQSQALATGQTNDLSSVITSVQEAQLSMQLATQVRNKAVEAYTEIFHTQI